MMKYQPLTMWSTTQQEVVYNSVLKLTKQNIKGFVLYITFENSKTAIFPEAQKLDLRNKCPDNIYTVKLSVDFRMFQTLVLF